MNRLSLYVAAAMSVACAGSASAALTDIASLPDNPFRSAQRPGAEVYAVVPSHQALSSYDKAYFGRLDPMTGELSPIYENALFTNRDEYDCQSGSVRGNILYIPDFYYDEGGMVTGEYTIRWKRYDLLYGREMEPLVFGTGQEALKMYFYSMTYDEAGDCFYGLALDLQTGNGGQLVKVDCSSDRWRPELIGNLGGTVGDFMCNIVFNPAERALYGLKDNGSFYEIDPAHGNAYKVMQFDDLNEYYCFPMSHVSVPICYSPYDKSYLYIYADSNAEKFRLISIDAESYETLELSELYPLGYVTTLYCADPYAPDDAPDRVSLTSVDFEGDSLNGTYSLTVPSVTFGGQTLSAPLTLHILIDGAEIHSESVRPGTTVTGKLNVNQGLHQLTVYVSDSRQDGAIVRREFYAGYDRPLPPTGLALSGGILSWEAPAPTGVYGGNIDMSDMSYDVFVDGEKYNDAPVRTTSIPFSLATPAARREIRVSATAHETTSELSAPLSRVAGSGATLPVSYLPTAADAQLFETYNVNGDAYEFRYMEYSGVPVFRIYTNDYNIAPDDWLFMPPVILDSAEDLYTLAFTYRNATANALHNDNLDVYIGRDPLPEAMEELIYSHSQRCQTEYTGVEGNFTVPEPGTYYIGFHSRPGDNTTYRGVHLSDFAVSKATGSVKAPANPSDVEVKGAPLGALSVDVTATLPLESLDGSALPASAKLSLTASIEGNEVSKEGKPGEKMSLSIPVEKSGKYVAYVSAVSADGRGKTLTGSVFAGIDVPLAPTGVKGVISDDNLGVLITWDPVGQVGVNGGYVDPEQVTYDIYSYLTTGTTLIAKGTSDNEYTYRLPAPALQSGINIGPVAVNATGNSTGGLFFNDYLGTPYPVPMQEEFGTQQFNCQKWTFNLAEPFNHVEWLHATSSTVVAYGSPLFGVGGGLKVSTQSEEKVWGECVAPKASTKGVKAAKVAIRYWDYPGAAPMELWGRTAADQEFRRMAAITPEGKDAEWKEWETPLPDDFIDQGWIQVNVRACLDKSQFALIDNYRILQDISQDFSIAAVKAPYSTIVGSEAEFTVTVANAGSLPSAGHLSMELLGDGKVVAKTETSIGNVGPGETYDHIATFEIDEKYWQYRKMELRAIAQATNDQNPDNNEATAEFIIYDNVIPTVHDLSARREGSSVTLEWSQPTASDDMPESFEALSPFAITDRIGVWQNVDLDGLVPFCIDGARWQNDNQPCGWTVYDAVEQGTMNNDRLSPRSGTQMLIARSCEYDDGEQPSQNSDWLISPAVNGGSKVAFWMNCISDQFPETVQIWYSTTGTTLDIDNAKRDTNGQMYECGDFVKLRNFTKSGEETWEYCEATLPSEARYFALVYASYGDFAAMIDDISYSPSESVARTVDSYDILFRPDDGKLLTVAGGIKTIGHVLDDAPYRGTYYVVANVADNGTLFRGALSNPASVDGSGVEYVDGSLYVGAGHGRVLIGGAEGEAYVISDMSGRVISSGRVESDRFTVEVPAGILAVTVGVRTVKLTVR